MENQMYKARIYRHYGHRHLDPTLIKPMTVTAFDNWCNLLKPPHECGLWGSPIKSTDDWISWCERNDFRDYDPEDFFDFEVWGSIFKVCSLASAIELVNNYLDPSPLFQNPFTKAMIETDPIMDISEAVWSGDISRMFGMLYRINFQKMRNDGYSGMEISITDWPSAYNLCYGWDCDSVVVWDKLAIREV
jgi:hypothetical protein